MSYPTKCLTHKWRALASSGVLATLTIALGLTVGTPPTDAAPPDRTKLGDLSPTCASGEIAVFKPDPSSTGWACTPQTVDAATLQDLQASIATLQATVDKLVLANNELASEFLEQQKRHAKLFVEQKKSALKGARSETHADSTTIDTVETLGFVFPPLDSAEVITVIDALLAEILTLQCTLDFEVGVALCPPTTTIPMTLTGLDGLEELLLSWTTTLEGNRSVLEANPFAQVPASSMLNLLDSFEEDIAIFFDYGLPDLLALLPPADNGIVNPDFTDSADEAHEIIRLLSGAMDVMHELFADVIRNKL